MDIVVLEGQERERFVNHVVAEWGEPIVSRGNIIDIARVPGFAALVDGELAGAVLYEVKNGECEIVVLYSFQESKGVGTSLINAVIETAKAIKCKRVWLITMNDNTRAIRFYQRRGFDLKAVHINAFDVTRKLKKQPIDGVVLGIDGIPVKHEFEFEILM